MSSRIIIALLLIVLGIVGGILFYAKNSKSSLSRIESSFLEELKPLSPEETFSPEKTEQERTEELLDFEEFFKSLE